MESVDWVPVDELASVLVELSFSLAESKASLASGGGGKRQVFDCVNPHPIPRRDLVPVVVRVLLASLRISSHDDTDKSGEDEGGGVISVVGFREWLDRLESSATQTGGTASIETDMERNPALKLLGFYHRLLSDSAESEPSARLSSKKTVHVSKSLANLGPIQPEWMSRWVRDWLKH